MLEFERKFLAFNIPEEYLKKQSVLVHDKYIPKTSDHPIVRIRKKGNNYEITKKVPREDNDKTIFIENTIPLSEVEYDALSSIESKDIYKRRFFFRENNIDICIDIFDCSLKGLVIVEFEFDNIDDKELFIIPDYCTIEVSDNEIFAGGYLAGKKISDIHSSLIR